MEAAISKILLSQDLYHQTKQYRKQVLENDQPTMTACQQAISKILKNQKGDPLQKLLALKLAKDTMETFNDKYIAQVQNTFLPIMEKVAIFKYESPDHNRGVEIFKDNPSPKFAMIGNSFLRLLLECIFVWSKWFPIDPNTSKLSNYKVAYERLVKLGVVFPKLVYFKPKEVKKEMPECMIPIKMLAEARTLINQDYVMNQVNVSVFNFESSQKIVDQLELTVKKSITGYGDKFYVEKFRRCLRRLKANQDKQNKTKPKPKPIEIDYRPAQQQKAKEPLAFKEVNNKELEQLKDENLDLKFQLQKSHEEVIELKKQLKEKNETNKELQEEIEKLKNKLKKQNQDKKKDEEIVHHSVEQPMLQNISSTSQLIMLDNSPYRVSRQAIINEKNLDYLKELSVGQNSNIYQFQSPKTVVLSSNLLY